MSDLIPTRVVDRYSSAAARPKLVRVFLPDAGWQKADSPDIVTWNVVELLRSRGVTRIEIVWRFRRRELSLQRIGNAPELSVAVPV